MRLTVNIVLLFSCLSLIGMGGCSYLPKVPTPKLPKLGVPKLTGFPGVYKIDIQQGNVITQEMVDQLKPGMTKRQVQFVMGTPLIMDTFNQKRWDYVYSLQPGGKKRGQESVALYFENDRLSHFEGDYLPGSQP